MMQPTLTFLKALAKNNSKDWFDANRKQYDSSKADMEALIKNVIEKITKFDPTIGDQEAKKCLFRINRDIRFSKDKTPYKTNMGASINPGGRKSEIPGYYVHIEPGKSFLAGGCWMPQPEALAAIRQEIDYNGAALKKIMNAKDFKTYFGGLSEEEKVKSAPKGYDKDHPDIELLKFKHYIVVHPMKDSQVTDPQLATHIGKVFKAMHPFLDFLRHSIEH